MAIDPPDLTAIPLKYQNEIDAFSFGIVCPNEVNAIKETIEVFRFSHTPITNELNFLPNVVYDRLTGGKFPYSKPGDEEAKCRRCGASYYYDYELAKAAWSSLPEKMRINLKYTHMAKGNFTPGDGLISVADEFTHFGFYENENIDNDYLKTKFENLDPLQ